MPLAKLISIQRFEFLDDLKVELGRAVTLKQWKSGCETTPTLHRENGNKPRQIHIPEHAALIDVQERCRPHATSSCYLFIRQLSLYILRPPAPKVRHVRKAVAVTLTDLISHRCCMKYRKALNPSKRDTLESSRQERIYWRWEGTLVPGGIIQGAVNGWRMLIFRLNKFFCFLIFLTCQKKELMSCKNDIISKYLITI